MMARNEEPLLPFCLDSVRAAVDEIILVDTGSTDRTAAIAKRFGARVLRIPWRNDFSEPRRLSFRHARGDWILFLDADEKIAAGDLRRLRTLPERPDVDAWRLEQRTYTDVHLLQDWRPSTGEYPREERRAGTRGWIPYRVVRLFRNLPGLQVEGAHPDVEPWLRAEGRAIRDAPVPIHHFKVLKGPEASLHRLRQNLRVARRQALSNPRDMRAWRDLGCLLYALHGRHVEAFAALRRAVGLEPSNPEMRLLLAMAFLDAARPRSAIASLRRALALPGRKADAHALLGIALARSGRAADAARHLRRAIAIAPHHVVALNHLGILLARRGDRSGARARFREALRYHPHYAPARMNLDCGRTAPSDPAC